MIKDKIKQNVSETFKLLWAFKWYVAFDLLFLIFFVIEYFNPPAADDMIWGSEAMQGAWNYQNQQLYIQSCKYNLIISTLVFLIGTSNMRCHLKLAKFIFLFPIYLGWLNIL